MQELYLKSEIIEKFQLQTKAKNPPINEFIRYCHLRGIEIKRTFYKRNKQTLFEIVEDNRVLPNEEWRFNEDEKLWVSSLGRIMNIEKRFLTLNAKIEGYAITKSNTTGNYLRIHRLVINTFQPIENSQFFDVDHINGIRNDNRLENLRWVNTKENIKHKDKNQTEIGDLVAKLVQKYGYNETFDKIQSLLDENN